MMPTRQSPLSEESLVGFEVLLVEDDPSVAESLGDALREEGCELRWAKDGQDALTVLRERTFDLVISDVRMPRVDGMQLFQKLREERPETPVILMSAYGTVREAVSALRERAVHYLAKPFDLDELLDTVRHVSVQSRSMRKATEAADDGSAFSLQTGDSLPMEDVRRRIVAAAETDVPVLIHGASGTGKELVAKSIHELSTRKKGPFIAINCASLPEPLFEAELFGYEKGAFTGAAPRREGLFRAADGGTIFLDEVGEMPLSLQAKLLRVLQDSTIQPLGSDRSFHVDVRVLSATNLDLRAACADGRFREDLFYRLRVFDIRMPTLRERIRDLPLLVAHILLKFANGRQIDLTPRAWGALFEYPFPGNIRELEHAIRHALVLCGKGPIDVTHLPDDIRGASQAGRAPAEGVTPLAEAVVQFEREYLIRVLEQVGGSKTKAARLLGVSRKCVWEKLKRYGVE